MHSLPEPKPTAPAAGQAHNPLTDAVIQAAIDNAIHEARRLATSPPARKPERPAMSSKATDDSVRMIAFGGMTLMICGGASGVMLASDFADPTVIGMICAAPAAIAVPILAIARVLRRAKEVAEAAPAEIHNHYNGAVHQDQRQTHSRNVGVIANTRNNPPRRGH